jgi:hypothetical protein
MAKPTNQELVRLLRQTKKLALQDIRLVESHSKLGRMKDVLPPEASQTVGVNIQMNPAAKAVIVVVSIKVVCLYEDSQEADPPVMISANFGLSYTFSKPISRKLLGQLAQQVALLNVWPYWREFVQSISLRMGLPAFPVPLMNFGTLGMREPGTVEDKKRE